MRYITYDSKSRKDDEGHMILRGQAIHPPVGGAISIEVEGVWINIRCSDFVCAELQDGPWKEKK